MADIRTSCPTKLCYLQKSGSVGISSYQFIYSNPYILSRCRVNVLPISRIYSDNPCASAYFQGPTPSPLTQTPSTPKHTNPIQQSSRNRKAVIPSRQKNPTKTKTLPAFSSSLLFFFSPSVIPINAAFLCYTRQGTPPCPRDAPLIQSGRAPPGYCLANEKFGGIFNPPS